MTLRTPKSSYKIFIISLNKYYSASGSRSKATWTSLGWALEAATEPMKRYGASDMEIHEFPVTSAIKHDLKSLMEEKLSKKMNKEQKKLVDMQKHATYIAHRRYEEAKIALDDAEKELKRIKNG